MSANARRRKGLITDEESGSDGDGCRPAVVPTPRKTVKTETDDSEDDIPIGARFRLSSAAAAKPTHAAGAALEPVVPVTVNKPASEAKKRPTALNTDTENSRGASPRVSAATRTSGTTRKRKAADAVAEAEDDRSAEQSKRFKEGQRDVCPARGDGTRAFYESLLKENPNSLIGIKYCVEHGVLMGTQHKEYYQRYLMLKDLGAYKGSLGGVKASYSKGVSKAEVESWSKGKYAAKSRVTKTTPTAKRTASKVRTTKKESPKKTKRAR